MKKKLVLFFDYFYRDLDARNRAKLLNVTFALEDESKT